MRSIGLRTPLGLAAAGLVAFAVSACGGGDPPTEDSNTGAPAASSFPPTDGGSLDSVLAEARPSNDVVVSPAGKVFTEGRNRFGFGVFSADGGQIDDAEVAIYAAAGANGKAAGPFPARVESLATDPPFTAQTTANDPDAATDVYVTDLTLDQPGEWRMVALVRRGDELSAVRLPSAAVRAHSPVPGVGERAPVIHTPTADEVGNVSEIDTRIPPDDMHDVDFADVVGKQPVALLFATPALCQSRVCGPVVDVAEQVKRDTDTDTAFIHMEIYEHNKPPALRPQVRAFHLPTEPWLFVIGCDGTVETRIEGAFDVAEMSDAVDRTAQTC